MWGTLIMMALVALAFFAMFWCIQNIGAWQGLIACGVLLYIIIANEGWVNSLVSNWS